MVEGIVEAGDEVEITERRQLAHIGFHELSPRGLESSSEQGDEALSSTARDVEDPGAAKAVPACERQYMLRPGLVIGTGREGVIEGREGVIAESVGVPARRHR